MYTIRDYTRAIRSRYSPLQYRSICAIYGFPHRDVDINPNLTVSNVLGQVFLRKLNTRDQSYGSVQINIEVDSPTQTRVQVMRNSNSLVRWYTHRRYGAHYALYRSRHTYTNPTPEYIASLVPSHWTVSVKYLYARVCQRLFARNLRSARRGQLAMIYDYHTQWTTWRDYAIKWFVQYIPFVYVRSFSTVRCALVKHYGVGWMFVNIRGGFYGSGVEYFNDTYTFDSGGIKYRFVQKINDQDRVVAYYCVTGSSGEAFAAQRLTRWRLWRLVRALPVG